MTTSSEHLAETATRWSRDTDELFGSSRTSIAAKTSTRIFLPRQSPSSTVADRPSA